jgi:hypothetical protein
MGATMNTINAAYSSTNTFDEETCYKEACCENEAKTRYSIQGNEPSILTDIYQDQVNMAIWQRQLSSTLISSVTAFLIEKPTFKTSMTVSADSVLASISESLGSNMAELSENIAELVQMFSCLFELKRIGLRLTVIDSAMCPKFHVDNVPCRLITTFQGVGTEWLPHQVVNREKLGRGSVGKTDSESGIYKNQHAIQQLNCGDVALLKGEHWKGNEAGGLVHRSPALLTNERRLILTLDFSY